MRRVVLLSSLLLLLVAFASFGATIPTIEHTHVFYFNDVSDYPDLKKEFMTEFSKKFNVNLVINTFPRNTYMDNLNLAITSGESHGNRVALPPGPGPGIPRSGRDPAARRLPEGQRGLEEAARLHQERRVSSTTARPGTSPTDGESAARTPGIYRKDWADKLGFAKPETVDQLYAMSKAFTVNDPDGNGKQDTWGMTNAGDAWNLQDLFAAYDARTNNFGADCIVYDPNENAWIDTMLKPEMIDALTFINKIYKEGILDPECFVNNSSAMRTKMYSGKYGSVFYGYWWGYGQPAALLENLAKNAPEAKIDYILALKGKRTTNINQIVARRRSARHAGEHQGPEGHDQRVRQHLLRQRGRVPVGPVTASRARRGSATASGCSSSRIPPPAAPTPAPPLTSGILPGWTGLKGIGVVEGDKAAIDSYLAMYGIWKKTIESTIAKGLIYDASGLKDVSLSPTYTKIINDVRKFWKELLAKVATGTVTPTDAVAQYRAFMKSIDGQKMLVETNQKMGLKLPAKYTY